MAVEPKRTPDGAIDLSEDFGNAFDDVLDELHSNPSLATPTHEPDRMALDDVLRTERLYFAALAKEVNERLAGQGLGVTRVLPNGYGNGFIIELMDRQRRRFETEVSIEGMLELGEQYGENMGRELIDVVCTDALAARERYFRRMM